MSDLKLLLPFRKNKRNGFSVLTLHYTADHEKCGDWVEDIKKKTPEAKFAREYEIDWNAAGGTLVYPFFQKYHNKIVCEPFEIPEDEGWFTAGFDHGSLNPTAFLIAWCAPSGDVYVVWEYYAPGHYLEHVKGLRECPWFERVNGQIWCDPSMSAQTQQTATGLKSMIELYRGENVHMIAAPRTERGMRAQRIAGLWNGGVLEDADPKLRFFSSCPNLIRELKMLRHEQYTGLTAAKRNVHEGVLKKDDHCLVPDTMVSTDVGDIPIKDVRVGMRVLTTGGYRNVKKSCRTGVGKWVRKVNLSDGSSVVGTPGHPVWVKNKGWVPIDALEYGDILLQCVLKKSGSEESSTGAILTPRHRRSETTLFQEKPIGKKGLEGYTKKSGSKRMGRSRTANTSITRTGIQATTNSQTLNASPQESISMNTGLRNEQTGCAASQPPTGTSPLRGTEVWRAERGTLNTLARSGQRNAKTRKARSAVVAAKSTRYLSSEVETDIVLGSARPPRDASAALITSSGPAQRAARSSARVATATRDFALVSVLSVTDAGKSDVYNLHVDEYNEFFANGVRVHNSWDALSYLSAANDFFSTEREKENPNCMAAYMRHELEKQRRRDEIEDPFFADLGA